MYKKTGRNAVKLEDVGWIHLAYSMDQQDDDVSMMMLWGVA
jgi:hypothetical protein